MRPVAAALAAVAVLALAGCDDAERAGGQGAGAAGEAGRSEPTGSRQVGEAGGAGADAKPAEEILFRRGDSSDQVRELQARLAQLGFFAAKPTGFFGDVTLGSVSEFQRAQGLKVTGEVSEATWAALTEQTTMPTREEMFPPRPVMDYGETSDQVRELQARLAQLGHFDRRPTGYYGDVTAAAVTAYQQAAGLPASGTVDETTWEALTGETTMPSQEEMFPPLAVPEPDPAELDERCLRGRVLCVSKTTSTLAWVVDGEVRSTMDVRFGAEETPTREGVFEVYWKSRHHHSTLYDSPMPYAMFFDGGQAVHYSEDFAANGYNGASHGCVNVRDEAAIAELFDEVKVGDKVVVYW